MTPANQKPRRRVVAGRTVDSAVRSQDRRRSGIDPVDTDSEFPGSVTHCFPIRTGSATGHSATSGGALCTHQSRRRVGISQEIRHGSSPSLFWWRGCEGIAEIVDSLFSIGHEISRKIERRHPREIFIPRCARLRQDRVARNRIAPYIHLVRIKAELGRQPDGLTAAVVEHLRFCHGCTSEYIRMIYIPMPLVPAQC